MKYNELRVGVDKQELEVLTALLIENGMESMMIDDPSDEADIIAHPDVYKYDYINEELGSNPHRRPVVTVYFEDSEQGRAELESAVTMLGELGTGLRSMDIEVLAAGDDSEWLYKWQEHFKPTKVGERIVVKPSWEDYAPAEGELVIEMDPGMAFGSGLHETTSMCIRALEKVLPGLGSLCRYSDEGQDIEHRDGEAAADTSGAESAADMLRVLDVGTGTGILAIAAAMLGADECLGIDIDPDAVRVADSNIRHNGLEGTVSVQYGDLTEGVDYKADIIAANLMADLVIRLSPAAAEHLETGGWYITSGILDIKESAVCEAIESAGFEIQEVLHDGEWCAVVAVKR